MESKKSLLLVSLIARYIVKVTVPAVSYDRSRSTGGNCDGVDVASNASVSFSFDAAVVLHAHSCKINR